MGHLKPTRCAASVQPGLLRELSGQGLPDFEERSAEIGQRFLPTVTFEQRMGDEEVIGDKI